MNICENCGQKHNGSYGSGRFCCSKCARCFSTKNKRKEINAKVSDALTGRPSWNKAAFKNGYDSRRTHMWTSDTAKAASDIRNQNLQQFYATASWDELPLAEKQRRILQDQNNKCAECKISEWNGKPLVLEFHHIDGDNTNNSRENTMYLCPNCHSQTETFRRIKSSL